MSELHYLYYMNIEGEGTLPPDEAEAIEQIFDEAMRSTPGEKRGRCPFCEDGDAYQHSNGVFSCGDCLTIWIDDTDYQRLTESAETKAARLATEHQQALSEPLFILEGL